ncbi:MAG: hypothetical protein L6R40_004971 [Gallowayella cf. fulva]|nr:MAG: hypothetical protein L6R40_004971 [Xanthomendoza cf. fulva]
MPQSNEIRTKPTVHDEFVRMLVLETDEQHPDDHRERGSFGDVFDTLFKKAGDEHDPPLGIETVSHFVVEDKGGSVPKLEEMEDVHAILITGSMYDAHGEEPWVLKLVALIQSLWQKRPDIRFSGVCFGHQILCRALGAKIDSTPNSKWELAHTPISLTPIGARLFNNPEGGKIHLHQMHQDHVVYPPSSATTHLLPEQHDRDIHVWGSSATTEVQGVYIRERLFTTQGHLGFDEDMVHRQIEMRLDSGSIDREKDGKELENAKDTAEWEHDGVVVAGAILRFFHGDDDGI